MGRIQSYDPNTRQWSAITLSSHVSLYPSFSEFRWIYHDFHESIVEWNYLVKQFLPVPGKCSFIGATMWKQQILMAVEGEEKTRAFYLFEPSIPGEAWKKEDNWTLLTTLSEAELPDVIKIRALTL
ncbi:hypothetical protein SUGI_0222800 [Cryptomeria japonica]|nr:hypothetical protein SUGI_0222800 [Cryptomeria japonica]